MNKNREHFYNLIKNKEELLQFKTKILNKDFNIEIYEQIKTRLIDELGFIPSIITTATAEQKLFHMYRCRTLSSLEKNNQSYEELKSFTHPKLENCKGYGRANIPRNPVFYASSDAYTACKETRVKKGEKVFISEWNYKKGKKLRFTNLLSKPKTKSTERFRLFLDGYAKAIRVLNKDWQDKRENYELMNDIIYEIFTEDDNNYLYSSTLAYYNLFEMENIDFLLYPSIQSNKKSFNFAVNPCNLESGILKMETIKLVKLKNYQKQNCLEVEILKSGTIHKDKISW